MRLAPFPWYLAPISSSETSESDVESSSLELRALRKSCEMEVTRLCNKQADLEEKNKRLLDRIQHLENARLAREEATKDPREAEIYHHQRLVWDLQRRNSALELAAPFFKQISTQQRPVDLHKLDKYMDQIKSELESMLQGNEIAVLNPTTTIVPNSDLELLVRACLGVSPASQELSMLWNDCIPKYDSVYIVRGIAVAALREWVFDTDYPAFASDGVSSPLHKVYQSLAMDFGRLINI